MISLNFTLSNPWSKTFRIVSGRHGSFTHNKAWEVNIYRTANILNIECNINSRQDHAGIRLELGLLGYEIELHIYDVRHWDHQKDTWEIYK